MADNPNRKRIGNGWFLCLLEIMIQAMVFLAVSAVIYFGALQKPDSRLADCLLIVFPVAAAYLLRKMIRSFTVFIASHIILVAATAFLMGFSDNTQRVFSVMLGLALAAYSIHLKNKSMVLEDARNQPLGEGPDALPRAPLRAFCAAEYVPMPFVGLMAAGYLIGAAAGRPILMNIELILCILFIILQIFYNNMQKIQQLFALNRGKTAFPATQLKQVGIYITTGAALLVLGGMLLFYNGTYGNIFTVAKNGGLAFVRIAGKLFLFLLGLFGQKPKNVYDETETSTELTSEAQLLPPDESSPLMEALAETFGFLLLLAMLAGVLYLLIMYIRNFNRTKKQGQDYIEYIKPEERVQRAGQPKKKEKRAAAGAYKSIRRRYKHQILKSTGGKRPKPSSTPEELTRDHITADEKTAAEITRIYEKARYSDELVTPEETDVFKNLS